MDCEQNPVYYLKTNSTQCVMLNVLNRTLLSHRLIALHVSFIYSYTFDRDVHSL